MNTYAPIALFVYNRPQHTQQTVEALLLDPLAKQSDLYIFSDAAKHDGAKVAVDQIRSYINQISGFNKVEIVERTTNWGLANSVIDGVTRLCKDFGKVIVLEDDLVVSPHFLEYMNASLNKYQSDEKVMQIAGYMFPMDLSISDDSIFLPFISSWGWATWDRAWGKFDREAKSFELLKKSPALRRKFDLDGNYKYFSMLKAQQNGIRDSWAIRWYLSVFMNNGLALYPKKTLVQNYGFDGSGENCQVSTINEQSLDKTFKVTKFPENINVSPVYDKVLMNMPKPRLKLSSILTKIKRIMSKK
jgi:hypothetical protein